MASQVFYRKWRPQALAEVVGQKQVTQTLLNALSSGRVSHAYLFCGPRGTGKTSTGRILAKAVNCLNNEGKGEPCNTCPMCQAVNEGSAMDIIEIDAASNTGVDDIRSLREKVNYAPNQARYKVYIIDEVHMLSTSAANALLKTLEEPPPRVIFILATTEVHKVLSTIMSRCQRFDFRRISQADVIAKLSHIGHTEGIQIDTEALRLIARATTGSLRDAENLLQQLATYYGTEITIDQVRDLLGISGDWRARELAKHLVTNNVTAGIATINSVNSDGLDLRQFNREVVEYLRLLLLLKTGSEEAVDASAEDIQELRDLAAQASLPQLLKAVKLFGQLEIGFDNYSTLPLELALLEGTLAPAGDEKQAARPVEPRPQLNETKPSPVTPRTEAAEPQPEPVVKQEKELAPEPTGPVIEPAAIAKPEIAATKPSQPPVDSNSEVQRLAANWRSIIKEAPEGKGRTPAAALLRSARPKAFTEDTLVLSFKFPLHKENMEKIENQKTAEQIISHFLGHPCRVRCVYEPEANHLVEEAVKIGAQIIYTEEK